MDGDVDRWLVGGHNQHVQCNIKAKIKVADTWGVVNILLIYLCLETYVIKKLPKRGGKYLMKPCVCML